MFGEAGDENNMFAEQTEMVADQHLSVLPFKGQVQSSYPTGFKPNRKGGKVPEANLTLKWAHGFRSFDTYGNLKYTVDGRVVFTTAGIAVV